MARNCEANFSVFSIASAKKKELMDFIFVFVCDAIIVPICNSKRLGHWQILHRARRTKQSPWPKPVPSQSLSIFCDPIRLMWLNSRFGHWATLPVTVRSPVTMFLNTIRPKCCWKFWKKINRYGIYLHCVCALGFSLTHSHCFDIVFHDIFRSHFCVTSYG